MLCPTLVGRHRELDTLVTSTARGSTAFVSGEAGLGKSRLVREFAEGARERGRLVAAGRAVRSVQPLPYRALAEAVIGACRSAGPPDDPELAPFRPALGRLLPQWHRPDLDPALQPAVVLAEGVLRLLRVLGGGRGPVLVIEDAHWADPETLQVLEYLADHAAEAGMALVVTARPDSSPGLGLMLELVQRRTAVAVELTPLDPPEVTEMARATLGLDVVSAELAELLARAEGVPYLVEELLAGAVDAGVLVSDGAGWRMLSGARALVPQTVAEAISLRVQALARPDRDLVHLAALLGRRIEPDILAAATGRPAEEVTVVLERCLALQLLGPDEAGLVFRHALTRDAVLAGLHAEARRELARRARSALGRLGSELPDRWCSHAAELSLLAGDHDDAARLLLTAGRNAITGGALRSAAELLAQARPLAADGSPLALDIAEQEVHLAATAGDVEQAFAAARPLLVEVTDPDRRARIHLQLAEAASTACRWADAEAELADADRLSTDTTQQARRAALAAHVRLGAARVEDAEVTACEALALAERLELPEEACQALGVLGRIARERDCNEAEALFHRQLTTADRAGLTLWRLRATHELGGLDLMRANRTTRLQRARELAADAGALVTAATIDLQLSVSGWLDLDPEVCLHHSRRAQQSARILHLDLVLAEALLIEAAGHGFAGHRAAMELAITEAERIGRPEADLPACAWAHRATYALLREDRAGAIAAYDTAVDILRHAATVYRRPFWRYWALLRTVQDLDGDAARAEARAATAGNNHLEHAVLGYADAVAAGRRQHAAMAESLFAEARAKINSREFGAQRHLAERLAAECAIADGWGEPVSWLLESAAFFHQHGHEHVERACRSLLRKAGAAPPRHGARDVPDALAALGVTSREAEVFALVTEGLTSKEIATALYLSVRTVDKHVERLLAKTGVARRSELRTFRT